MIFDDDDKKKRARVLDGTFFFSLCLSLSFDANMCGRPLFVRLICLFFP